MPYNTTAIPPRKEPTGQTQLPLTRVKKIIAQDQDVSVCSNNAAFVITLATEMFIQYLATESQNMAKLERKPRRNIQYKDVANAVQHRDNLEFLEDMVPKTEPYKQVKAAAAATRAKFQAIAKGGAPEGEEDRPLTASGPLPNGKRHKSSSSVPFEEDGDLRSVNGGSAAVSNGLGGLPRHLLNHEDSTLADADLDMEERQAQDDDVDMTG